MDLNAVMSLSSLMRQANHTAKEKGWWEQDCPPCIGRGDFDGVPCTNCNGKGRVYYDRNFGEMIALMHSELSECLEHQRKGRALNEIFFVDKDDKKIDDLLVVEGVDKPDGIAVEFADVLIRIFDTCEELKIPLERALRMKMAYNKTRPYRHGGKKS